MFSLKSNLDINNQNLGKDDNYKLFSQILQKLTQINNGYGIN